MAQFKVVAALAGAFLVPGLIAGSATGQPQPALRWTIVEQDLGILRDAHHAARAGLAGRPVGAPPRVGGVDFYFGGQRPLGPVRTLARLSPAPVEDEDGIGRRPVVRLCGDSLLEAMRVMAVEARAKGANAVIAVRSDQPEDHANPGSEKFLCWRAPRPTGQPREHGPIYRVKVQLRGDAVMAG